MNTPTRVLSIAEGYLGHRTYGDLMRNYFNQSPNCQTDFYWYNEERELPARIINRFLSLQIPNPWIQTQNLDLHWFRIQLGFAYLAKRLAVRKLKQFEYTALHFHTQILGFLSLDLMKSIPTIVSLDMTAAQASRLKTTPSWRWTYTPNLYLEQKVYETAASVVAFSEAAQRSVIEDYNIEANKVQVVYPGVNLDRIQAVEKPSSRVSQPCQILFVGGDFERKGGPDLLAVFLENFTEQAELHLVTQAAIACSHPRVHIYPNIRAYTPEWLALYHQADVFVMPTYAEPFGWVFIEAMAAGLPIIATQLSAIPEMVSHGETGLLIQPGDRVALAHSIQTLLQNPTLRRQMGDRGRKVVEQKFDAQKNFHTLESLFIEVADKPHHQPFAPALTSKGALSLKS
ncbi:glycosyltransferase family 4 protein [Kovacikia minuta CCNUW1]|uniref:glycosyltransferase family 4 protein n=1 Tax=Kovacikia minuta TaxID=2931930 RepID=UPI001CCCC16B|nr:glycosyltransferase family 4 protein [Kovacikia minuta]UBF27179.1 glycosyltransferase family 4 protein [Kovacikia minuta CCNUW1]